MDVVILQTFFEASLMGKKPQYSAKFVRNYPRQFAKFFDVEALRPCR